MLPLFPSRRENIGSPFLLHNLPIQRKDDNSEVVSGEASVCPGLGPLV